MHVPSEPQLPTTRTWNFDKLDEKFCRPTAEDHRLYEFYGRAENSKQRTNELGQLCQLIERGAGAAIIFRARARRYDFIAAIKSE